MLVKYELLKIVRKKSTLIVMAVSLLVTALLFGLPVMRYQTYNQNGVIRGLEGIAYEREQYQSFSVLLTEEYIRDTIREYQQLFENPENVGYDGNERFIIEDAYWNFEAPRAMLLRLISGNYDRPGEYSGYNVKLLELDMGNGANFYQTRTERINELLNMPSRAMSEQQKEYWSNMNQKVETPFPYGFHEGWEIILTAFELLMLALLAICIVLAPVFAGEYQAGTDAVILAGKYGKTKLITAKIVSSFLFGIIAFTIHAIVALGIPLLAFGVDGWNLPLQILNTGIPYPFTFSQAILLNLAVIYIVLFGLIGITLFLSAKMKSPYLVLMILVPALFVPLFLTPSGTTGLYNLIFFLLPYHATVPQISKYISYQFGGLVLDVHSVRAILYGIITILFVLLARMGFKRHQVMG